MSDFQILLIILAMLTGSSRLMANEPVVTRQPIVTREPVVADAAEQRSFEKMSELINAGADVRTAQADGTTALHWAAYHDDADAAERLLAAGADAQATNQYGVAPLSLACENGNPVIVERLLKTGANPNTVRRGGETALMTAARTGIPEVVAKLLASGAEANRRDENQQTAIMWAAAEGHLAVVEAFLKAGADFKTPLKSGFTAYFFAVRNGHSGVVQRFLAAGVDVNSVMQPESSGGRLPRVGTSALLLAVENAHFELAAKLLDAGADPDDQRSGLTPLHLLSWVRKPNRGDGIDGDPPPIGSGELSSLEFVKKLVAAGASVNARLERGVSGSGKLNLAGATPFLMAARTADVPYLKLLLELGADPTIPNRDGSTALMAAAGLGTLAPDEEAGTEPETIDAVTLLLKLGLEVNAVDQNRETAMHGAAYKSLPGVVQLLADHGAKIDIWNRKNKSGWTPLLIAEGHRPGNFKPSAETVSAIHRVMIAAGLTPPPPTPRDKRKGYQANQ